MRMKNLPGLLALVVLLMFVACAETPFSRWEKGSP
jgi:hypothetical protein